MLTNTRSRLIAIGVLVFIILAAAVTYSYQARKRAYNAVTVVKSLVVGEEPKGPVLPKLIATYRDVPPDMLTYSPGRHSGPMRLVIEEAASRLGFVIEWKPMPFGKSLQESVAGNIDLIPYSHFKSPDREKLVRFSVSLGTVPNVVHFIHHADRPEPIDDFDDLRGAVMGHRPGSYYYEGFDTETRFVKRTYADDAKLMQAFADRKVEVVIVNNRKAAERALATTGYNATHYTFADLVLERETELYIMYSKNPAYQPLWDRMDQILLKMKEEGLIAKIYQSFDADPPKAN